MSFLFNFATVDVEKKSALTLSWSFCEVKFFVLNVIRLNKTQICTTLY